MDKNVILHLKCVHFIALDNNISKQEVYGQQQKETVKKKMLLSDFWIMLQFNQLVL